MRQIARIDIKNQWAIKGVHLEGLRKVGNPNELARRYYQDGIHEIVFMDAVASLYDRNNLFDVIERASQDVFVPIALRRRNSYIERCVQGRWMLVRTKWSSTRRRFATSVSSAKSPENSGHNVLSAP